MTTGSDNRYWNFAGERPGADEALAWCWAGGQAGDDWSRPPGRGAGRHAHGRQLLVHAVNFRQLPPRQAKYEFR